MKEESKATPAAKATPSADREEAIRRMAYTLYEARGRIGGHELEDWLRAEALVAQASAARPVASPPISSAAAATPVAQSAPAVASAWLIRRSGHRAGQGGPQAAPGRKGRR